QNKSLQQAASEVIHDVLAPIDASGGVIALDNKGNVVAEFNSTGMFRGWINSTGHLKVEIFE
ncbi:MAG: isoaspartyl peptidase/L-asparaginase, partial [Bacteroidota bacterium]